MGCCLDKDDSKGESDQESKLSRIYDRYIRQTREQDKLRFKLLLLGTGECGKSTILKQMKILHANGFSMEDRRRIVGLIRENSIRCMQILCKACVSFEIFLDEKTQKIADDICNCNLDDIPLDMKDKLTFLVNDRGIKKAFRNSSSIQLLDNAPYFLDPVQLERTFDPYYIPTDQDILKSRKATKGIVQNDFTIKGLPFRMYDVGGQRGERKKWIHCFDSVRAILWIASLSEYDQMLYEDPNQNRLSESLNLFSAILSLPCFRQTPVILFLNKNDLFKDKIVSSDLGVYFPSYSGGLNYKNGLAFITEEYRKLVPKRRLFVHVTDATDTSHIRVVWNDVHRTILTENLEEIGIAERM